MASRSINWLRASPDHLSTSSGRRTTRAPHALFIHNESALLLPLLSRIFNDTTTEAKQPMFTNMSLNNSKPWFLSCMWCD